MTLFPRPAASHAFAVLAAGALLLAGCRAEDRPGGSGASGGPGGSSDRRPNILLIVADDLGYGDLGSYGGDISTPNIDALAARGVRFTQFHTAPMCAPTRAMLLSGNDNHVAGMGNQGGGSGPTEGLPGYEGYLSARVIPFPALLGDAGYRTFMVGKWHLGRTPEHSPTAAGFQRSFSILQGAGDHFSETALTESDSVSTYWEDGAYSSWPEGRYATDLYTERLLGFIRDGWDEDEASGERRPFLAYAAYTSPHWPLQVPEEDLDLYRGRYDMGYQALRELRMESLKGAGIVPPDWVLPPWPDSIPPWDSLSREERRREARKMELYAAMLDNLDRHVGRLLEFLEDAGELENTLVVFMSDNGAAAEDFYNRGGFVDWLRRNYDNRLENMGRPGSFVSYGPQWAEAGSAPFHGHKQHMTEGGIVAPMIVAGPGVRAPEGGLGISRAYVGVMDLAPTFLELAGAEYPGARGTPATAAMTGRSLVPILMDGASGVRQEFEFVALAHRGRAFVRRGPWKAVTNDVDFRRDEFRLYDLASDPGETTDLSAQNPEVLTALLAEWDRFARDVGAYIPPAPASDQP